MDYFVMHIWPILTLFVHYGDMFMSFCLFDHSIWHFTGATVTTFREHKLILLYKLAN